MTRFYYWVLEDSDELLYSNVSIPDTVLVQSLNTASPDVCLSLYYGNADKSNVEGFYIDVLGKIFDEDLSKFQRLLQMKWAAEGYHVDIEIGARDEYFTING